ncbi:cuticle protein 21-like [Penaeus chinensis]|uniref:cuticle protein 21-like n=1 Tax=Penaeus chinensis TaxID=139456 RepID=UPI001FB5EA2B|nr:cuticle protein 21-like [Penaeus chinensis]
MSGNKEKKNDKNSREKLTVGRLVSHNLYLLPCNNTTTRILQSMAFEQGLFYGMVARRVIQHKPLVATLKPFHNWKLILNMSPKFIIIGALVAVALARPDQPPAYGYAATTPAFAPAKYDFNYAVKDEYSGNDFDHQEARDGDNTQGSYYVQLPDGRLQKVTYTVNGDSGFVADVSYEGEAQYPAEQPAYKHAPSDV